MEITQKWCKLESVCANSPCYWGPCKYPCAHISFAGSKWLMTLNGKEVFGDVDTTQIPVITCGPQLVINAEDIPMDAFHLGMPEFTVEHCRQIDDFVKTHQTATFVVNCQAGISRSCALWAGLVLQYHKMPMAKMWGHIVKNNGSPNQHIFALYCDYAHVMAYDVAVAETTAFWKRYLV